MKSIRRLPNFPLTQDRRNTRAGFERLAAALSSLLNLHHLGDSSDFRSGLACLQPNSARKPHEDRFRKNRNLGPPWITAPSGSGDAAGSGDDPTESGEDCGPRDW